MRVLLDTQIILWAAIEPDRLSAVARETINDLRNTLIISVVSLWEANLKFSTGKLTLTPSPEVFWPETISRLQATLLPILFPHALRIARLPLHHKDPFDRMLIAQALSEDMKVLTVDPFFDAYSVAVLK